MNKKYLKMMFLVLLTAALSPYLMPAEFNMGVNYNGYYNDNIFMNASNIKDYISQVNTDLNLSVEKFNFYLEASTDLYLDNGDFNSFNIVPGIEYLHSLKGRNTLYLDLSYAVLNYRDLYTDFNYNGPTFQAGTKLYITPQTLFKANYRFQSRNYTNFESFDFYNHTASLELSHFFKSQTTLKLETGYLYRYYPHIIAGYDFGENYNYFTHRGSEGKGSRFGGPRNQNPDYNTLSVPGFYGLFTLAQGIGTRLGITGQVEIRHYFRDLNYDRSETLVRNAYVLYPLNDDYLWDGLRLGLKLNTVLFKTLAVEGEVSFFKKDYPGIYILDAEGNVVDPATQREDSLLRCRFKMSKKIRKFDLFVNLLYRDNNSNDDYFFYKMLTISAGIGYYF